MSVSLLISSTVCRCTCTKHTLHGQRSSHAPRKRPTLPPTDTTDWPAHQKADPRQGTVVCPRHLVVLNNNLHQALPKCTHNISDLLDAGRHLLRPYGLVGTFAQHIPATQSASSWALRRTDTTSSATPCTPPARSIILGLACPSSCGVSIHPNPAASS